MRYRHLPPGHEPGRQSRRDRFGFPIFILFGTVFGGALFAVASVYALTDGAVDRADFGLPLLTLLSLAGGYAYIHERYPRRSRRLRLTVSPVEARRGGAVTATVTIDDGGGANAQSGGTLQVGLVCVERYDRVWRGTNFGKSSVTGGLPVTEQEPAHEDWRDVEVGPIGQSVQIEIPIGVPYSYEGHHVSFAWRVSAREPRAGRPDPGVDHPIWVLP